MGFYLTQGPTPRGLWDFRLSLPGGVAFSRPASGTIASRTNALGVLEFAGANVPRLDYDPISLKPLGLLIEPAAANFAPYSTTMGAWGRLGTAAMAENAAIAPDGTMSAERFSAVNGYSNRISGFAPGLTPSATHTLSIWLNGVAGSQVNLQINTGNGTYATKMQTVTIAAGWQRFSMSFTLGGDNTAVYLVLYGAGGTAAFDAWGVQLEAGSSPSSFIPTTSATVVARSADAASITLASPSDLLVQDVAGAEWRDGVAAGPVALSPRAGQTHIGRVQAFAAGTLTAIQKTALGGPLA